MALSQRQILHSLSLMPFADAAELVGILGEPPANIHRKLTVLHASALIGRVNHGTTHLPSSRRYYLTAKGINEASRILGFATPSDFVRAYPMSKEWLALVIRRMDAVASIYRLAATLSPETDGFRSRVELFRRGRFDAAITLHDGRKFGVIRQGLALRRRSLYDRLRTIAEYDYTRRPEAILVLTPNRMGGKADGAILHRPESPKLLRYSRVQGSARKPKPPPVAANLVPCPGMVLLPGDDKCTRQLRWVAAFRVAQPQTCLDT